MEQTQWPPHNLRQLKVCLEFHETQGTESSRWVALSEAPDHPLVGGMKGRTQWHYICQRRGLAPGEDRSAGRQLCRFEDQSRRTERRTRIDYGRWLRERDTKELVYAVDRLSYELALIKRDERTSASSVVDYGRWLRERDTTEELIYAVGRLSHELALIKCDDRTSVSFRESSQD